LIVGEISNGPEISNTRLCRIPQAEVVADPQADQNGQEQDGHGRNPPIFLTFYYLFFKCRLGHGSDQTFLSGCFEDRCAVRYLQSRPDVRIGPIGCVGLSGGGCRAALLQASCDTIGAAVIVGMMTAYPYLLDHQVDCHTWMFFPPGLARFADWPDLAASRAPSPLLVQYDRDDQLLPIQGMEAAHRRIASHYERVGRPNAYLRRFYDGPHKFDAVMQGEAFAWLHSQLHGPGNSGGPSGRTAVELLNGCTPEGGLVEA
jgi:hypothetical protein